MTDFHPQLLHEQAIADINAANNLQSLEKLRVKYLGKKGLVTEQLKRIGSLDLSLRREAGQVVNQIKKSIQVELDSRHQQLHEQASSKELDKQVIDVSLPARGMGLGTTHPVSRTIERICQILSRLGFNVATGPEIESDYYNFEALNIPAYHPARAMFDTFYVDEKTVLRTHTSPVQIRYMLNNQPPLHTIAPGRVYRCDSDVTHTPMFHQVEGLAVDKNISFADLKGVLSYFIKEFFDQDLKVKFRPSYFPFTEPSAEVDISCMFCKGNGCRVCSHSGWLEVLGCGMVHPNVFKNVNVDTQIYSGYAFGIGVERLAMLRYGVNDLRLFFENDMGFLRQFQAL